MTRILSAPNVSEGRDKELVARIAGPHPPLIDIHTDPDHHRAVLTYAGSPSDVESALHQMVHEARSLLDLRHHEGAHPRFGVVDVIPIVPYPDATAADAVALADAITAWCGDVGIPAYRYGDDLNLPDLRRGLRAGVLAPAAGPPKADPRVGVVCVGVRGPLVAFNVDLRAPVEVARRIAADIRTASSGIPGLRALGLTLRSRGLTQVSMNLTEPLRSGISPVFNAVTALATRTRADVAGCEIVGLIPDELATDVQGLPLERTARTVTQAAQEGPQPPSGSGRR